MTQPEKLSFKEVLCPVCSEPCQIKIDEYKISLINCKNEHKTENLKLSELQEIIKKQKTNENKFYICETHKEKYEKYCETCKLDLCQKCEEGHKEHSIIEFKKKIPDKNQTKKNEEKLKFSLKKFKENIKDVINQLNQAMNNFDNFYQIIGDINDSIDDENMNFHKAKNLAYINDFIRYEMNDFKNIILS